MEAEETTEIIIETETRYSKKETCETVIIPAEETAEADMEIRIIPEGEQQTPLIHSKGIKILDTRACLKGPPHIEITLQTNRIQIPGDNAQKDPSPITDQILFMDPGQNTTSRDMENPDPGLAEVL